jgi:hypothetical protein
MQAVVVLLLFRHLHFFVVINDAPRPPQVQFETKQYYVYTDPLRVSVYAEQGDRLLRTSVPVGTKLDRVLPEPVQKFYLIEADPGMNGAIFNSDRPWGVVGSANHPMGVNGPGPQLYFYVPSDCTEIIFGAQSVSPNEGGRIVIRGPDGRQAGVLDGELDREEQAKVAVAPEARDRIWSLTWAKPETSKAALDDLNFWLDGNLTPLLFPRLEWAEEHGKALWERDRAARAQ